MALLNKKKSEDTATETNETTAPETPATETTAVATKAKSEMVVAPELKNSVFITNPLFLEAVAGADWGTFPSIIATNGTHMVSGSNGADLGKVLKFQAILANTVWKIVPGSSDEEAKDYFKVSKDGEVCNDGQDIQEALQDALDAGYSKASIKEYVDVICIITECADADYVGETMTLQLAPSSQYTWRPLAGKCKMKAAMGKLEAEPVLGDPTLGSAVVFTSTAKPTSYKGNNFTKLEFSI